MRVLWMLGIVVCWLGVTGCVGVPVDRVSNQAQEQAPQAGPETAWSARGRLTLHLPGRVMSLTTFLRYSDGGELRVAMMDDSGLVVTDLSYGETGAVIHHCKDEMVALIPVFEALFLGSYAPAGDTNLEWRSGRLRETEIGRAHV